MADHFEGYQPGLDAPASGGDEVTPGASPLANVTRAIYLAEVGDLQVTMLEGQTITLRNAPAGIPIPLRVTHILAAPANTLALW